METAKASASLKANVSLIIKTPTRLISEFRWEVATVFMQKLKVSLRFIGILLMRVLLGYVVGYVWMCAVAYLFHIIMDVRFPRDPIDYFYDSGPPREGRYGGRAGEVYGTFLQVGSIGFLVWFAIGILWGFSQGRLDVRRLLRNRKG